MHHVISSHDLVASQAEIEPFAFSILSIHGKMPTIYDKSQFPKKKGF